MKREEFEKLYPHVLQNPFVGICIADGQGICLYVNDAQVRISGIPREEFVGKDIRKLVQENLLSVSSTAEVLKKRKEINLHQSNAKGKAYDVKAEPVFGENGEIKYVISYLLDVSELQKFQDMVSFLQKDKEKTKAHVRKLLAEQRNRGELVFQSKKMENIAQLAKKIAKSDATVLISGSSGSGKELIANLIHDHSSRAKMPFIKINCAALPEQLLESELFGYEPGAFTGSSAKGGKGIFESADGGTLLLDEIGEMPLSLQAKLLRVLQGEAIRRVGGSLPVTVNVRIIASTNASLETLIRQNRFREDLYYRLNVIKIEVPDLKERKEDIPILISHFINFFNVKYGTAKTLSWEAIRYLSSLDFPGNVRELKNVIERLVLQSQEDEISRNEVFESCSIQGASGPAGDLASLDAFEGVALKDIVGDYEKIILQRYMQQYKRADVVSEKLKIDRSTLSRKLSRYGL